LKTPTLLTVLRENRTLFVILSIGLLLVELEIFAVAVMKSGRKSWLQVYDRKGSLIHESSGQRLSDFNKYYFEKTFGPLSDYEVKLVTRDVPFPVSGLVRGGPGAAHRRRAAVRVHAPARTCPWSTARRCVMPTHRPGTHSDGDGAKWKPAGAAGSAD
jgi:hypothetical protein